MINNLPEWLQIFLLSMIPGIESRFIIPIAVIKFGWDWWNVFPISIAGNMILVPFGLLFLHKIEEFLGRFNIFRNAMDKVFPKIRKKANKKIRRYETFALVFFVAIPLPFTGAGLGVLIAYLFDLKFSKSLIMIFIGVIISACLVTSIMLTGYLVFFYGN
jgi:uncharacterized membrane protein